MQKAKKYIKSRKK